MINTAEILQGTGMKTAEITINNRDEMVEALSLAMENDYTKINLAGSAFELQVWFKKGGKKINTIKNRVARSAQKLW